MRFFKHSLQESKSGKSVLLRVQIDDRFGKTMVNFSKVTGWRKEVAQKYLSLELETDDEWGDDVARVYVGLEVLKSARNRYEAIQFVNIVKSLTKLEVHFWASKFLSNERTIRAWRVLYL